MNAMDTFKMDKSVLSVTPLSEESDEKAYWHSKTPHERLEAVELMRLTMAMIQLPLDFKEFLKLLNSHHVEYLLI